MRVRTATLNLVLGAMLFVPMPARAVPNGAIVSPPGAFLAQGTRVADVAASTGYAPTVIAARPDGEIVYANVDVQSHNLVSNATTTNPQTWDPRYCDDFKPGGWLPGDPLPACPLFQSFVEGQDPPTGLIELGQAAPVLLQMPDGSPKLQPGRRYTFFCEPHSWMQGTLIALP